MGQRLCKQQGLEVYFRREQNLLKKKCILNDVEPWQHRLRNVPLNSSQSLPGPSLKRSLASIFHSGRKKKSEVDKCSADVSLPYVVGTDISFVKENGEDACVALVVMKLPELEVVYEDISMVKLTVPYMPGFLAFREAEFSIKKVKKLRKSHPEFFPLVIMVDGNGTLHDNEFGLACHVGVKLDMISLGVAKNLYMVKELEETHDIRDHLKNIGDVFPLSTASGKVLGVAIKSTADSIKPIYISPGHKISLETAIELVKLCCKYRVPEPIRQADIRSRQYIRDHHNVS